MIKCEVRKGFTLQEFDSLKNLKRAGVGNKKGELYTGDTFECSKKMADYLTGNNDKKQVVVDIKEIIPDTPEIKKPTKRTRKKKV